MHVPVNKLKIKIQKWKNEVTSYILRKMNGSSIRDARAWGYRVLSMAEHLLADMKDILYVIVEESMSGRLRMEMDYPPRRTGELDPSVKEGVPMICQWEDVGSEEGTPGTKNISSGSSHKVEHICLFSEWEDEGEEVYTGTEETTSEQSGPSIPEDLACMICENPNDWPNMICVAHV
jgi:hypothetical protein